MYMPEHISPIFRVGIMLPYFGGKPDFEVIPVDNLDRF